LVVVIFSHGQQVLQPLTSWWIIAVCLSSARGPRVAQRDGHVPVAAVERPRHTWKTVNPGPRQPGLGSPAQVFAQHCRCAAALKSACAKVPVNVTPAGRGPARPLTRNHRLLSSAVAGHRSSTYQLALRGDVVCAAPRRGRGMRTSGPRGPPRLPLASSRTRRRPRACSITVTVWPVIGSG